MKNKEALKWILKNTKKYIPAVFLIAVLAAFVSVGYVALAYVARMVIDIASGAVRGDIKVYIALLAFLILMQALLFIINSNIKIRVIGKLEIHLKRDMFERLSGKEYSKISKIHSGDILNRFTSDIEVVVSSLVGIIPNAVSLAARLLAAFLVLLQFDKGLTLIILALGIVVAIAARIYSVFFKNIHKKVQESLGETRSFMQECTENMVAVKSFNSAATLGEKLKKLMGKTYKLKLKRNAISNISSVAVYILFTGGYYAALCFGAFMIGNGLTFGELTAMLAIISQIKGPITGVSGLIPQYFSALASAERIIELENIPDEPKAKNRAEIDKIYENMKEIKFQNLSFSYAKNTREILENADMRIPKGEIVALVGPSGEGKSTIFRLLLGLWNDYEGEISIEGQNKISLTPAERGLFAYVPQGNLILSGTVAENIRFCRTDAADSEVEEAAKCADLYDFVKTLPEGFETHLGERGQGFSEGQVQRISVARAVLSGAPILLLDECTSALDEETERKLLENIKALGKTAIIISHKKAALDICDRIYRLDGGRLTEEKK